MLAYSNLIAYVKNKLLSYYTKDEVYNKTETYNTSEVYNKTETYDNTEVYNKTESYAKAEVYNKDESYNKDEVYNKTESYNQSEIDSFLSAQNDAVEITYDDTGNSFSANNVQDAIIALDNKPSVATLVDLTDTVITNPQDGHGILYDLASNKWINGTVVTEGGGGGSYSNAILSRYYELITTVKDTFAIDYTVDNGVAYVDIWLNGVKIDPSEFTAIDGTSIVLSVPVDGTVNSQPIEIIAAYSSSPMPFRIINEFVATPSQDTFNVTYGEKKDIDLFFEGHRLTQSEFTADDGSTVVLATPCIGGETLEIIVYIGAV